MMRRRAIHPTESRLAASAVAAEVVVSSAFDGASCGLVPGVVPKRFLRGDDMKIVQVFPITQRLVTAVKRRRVDCCQTEVTIRPQGIVDTLQGKAVLLHRHVRNFTIRLQGVVDKVQSKAVLLHGCETNFTICLHGIVGVFQGKAVLLHGCETYFTICLQGIVGVFQGKAVLLHCGETYFTIRLQGIVDKFEVRAVLLHDCETEITNPPSGSRARIRSTICGRDVARTRDRIDDPPSP